MTETGTSSGLLPGCPRNSGSCPSLGQSSFLRTLEPCWTHARYRVEAEAPMPLSGRERTGLPWPWSSAPRASGSHPTASDHDRFRGGVLQAGGIPPPHFPLHHTSAPKKQRRLIPHTGKCHPELRTGRWGPYSRADLCFCYLFPSSGGSVLLSI